MDANANYKRLVQIAEQLLAVHQNLKWMASATPHKENSTVTGYDIRDNNGIPVNIGAMAYDLKRIARALDDGSSFTL